MQVDLDIAADDPTKGPHELVHLSWVRTPDCVSNTDTVDTDLVDGLVDAEKVDEVGTEGILGRETDFDSLRLDKVDDLDSSFGDIGHVFSMREFPKEGRGANNDINTINT